MNLDFRLLGADEIEARIAKITQKYVTILLYKNARCDMNILDETVGPMNWQRDHKDLKGRMYAGIGILDSENGWVWKWDCGTESYTEAEKGEASDSFKRAGFNWGIGRELYTAPGIKFKAEDCKIDNGRCYDRFDVQEIEYRDHKISWVKVVNTSTNAVFTWGKSRLLNEENKDDLLTEEQGEELRRYLKAADVNEPKLLEKYEVELITDLNMTRYTAIINKCKKIIVERALKEVEDD